jgi:hypothetical protein
LNIIGRVKKDSLIQLDKLEAWRTRKARGAGGVDLQDNKRGKIAMITRVPQRMHHACLLHCTFVGTCDSHLIEALIPS